VNGLLAIAPVATWTLENWFVAIIIVAAVVGIVYLALQYFGVEIPPIVLRIIGIVIVAAIAIIAVRFLFTL
jgi:hypothetical protein